MDPSATTEDINRALDEYGGELPVERMAVVGASPLQTRIAAKEVHDRYDQLFSVQQSLMVGLFCISFNIAICKQRD